MNLLLHSPSNLVNPLARQRFMGFGTGSLGGGGFSPLSLSPMFWLDATQLGLSNGASVSSFTDLSGNGNHFVQSVPALRPTYNSTGINSRPSVQFDFVDDLMTCTHAATTAFTLWAIWKPTTAGSSRQRLYSDIGGNRLMGIYDGSRTLYTGSFFNNGSPSTQTLVYIAQASSSGRSLRINGTTVTDATSAGTLSGIASLGQGNELVSGHIGQMGLLNRTLTAGELTALVDYLTVQSGVAA
jgi:hypothetical protein